MYLFIYVYGCSCNLCLFVNEQVEICIGKFVIYGLFYFETFAISIDFAVKFSTSWNNHIVCTLPPLNKACLF